MKKKLEEYAQQKLIFDILVHMHVHYINAD